MAEAIAIFLITELAGAAAAGGTLLAVTETVVGLGIAFGASALAQSFMTKPGAPDSPSANQQFIVKGEVLPRTRSYGIVRVAGAQVFVGDGGSAMFRILAHADGRIDGVEEHVIAERVFPLGADGYSLVDPASLTIAYPAGYVRVFFTLGEDDPDHYATVALTLPEWSTDRLGRGVAHSATIFYPADQEVFRDVYPNAHNTTYKQTLRAALVWDPRDPDQDPADPDTWAWSDNAVLIILDYLRHRTGYRMPLALITAELDAWIAEADACDEAVALKRGGTEPRYRAWGTYSYAQRPSDVLDGMLAACNGRLLRGPSGGIRPSVGRWVAPTVTIDDAALIGYEIGAGNDGPSTANTLRASYTEPNLSFTDADAAPWVDDDAVAAFGEEATSAQLTWCPSHSQARRLMKQAAARLAPAWKGTLTTNLRGLAAMDQRFVSIAIGEMGLAFTAEIDECDLILAEGVVTGARIAFTSMGPEAFSFDAETEEGDPPQPAYDPAGDNLKMPAGFAVLSIPTGEAFVARLFAGVAAPHVSGEFRLRAVGETDWRRGPVSARGENWSESVLLEAGVSYEVQARLTSGYGRISEWSAAITAPMTNDTVAPGAPTALSATNSAGDVTVAWTQPASANVAGARVYHNTVDDAGTATLIADVIGTPSAALTHVHADQPAGAHWYWVEPFNGSGLAGPRTPAGNLTI